MLEPSTKKSAPGTSSKEDIAPRMTFFYARSLQPRHQRLGRQQVTSLENTFTAATAFNQEVGDWDTSKVTCSFIPLGAKAFNQEVGAWDTSKVTSLR